MNSKEVKDRFEELNRDNKLICTENELEEFLVCGLLFKSGDNYVTRSNVLVDVDIFKIKQQTMNINLSNLIADCEEKAIQAKCNKVYCMTSRCYNKYKEDGLIITKGDNDFYRLFDKELWLVNLID